LLGHKEDLSSVYGGQERSLEEGYTDAGHELMDAARLLEALREDVSVKFRQLDVKWVSEDVSS
jgi:hypothetical protein